MPMGVVVKFEPVTPRDGKLTHDRPHGALALETRCDYGHCDGDGWAWRYSRGLRSWLVVCVRCAGKPEGEPRGA